MGGIAAGALFGGLFFLWIAGSRVVDPAQFEWLMKSDWRINFLGWHLFRNDAWQWPPGTLEGYLRGEGTTIGLTDSVPVVALLLKPFDAWLPTPFQYFGLWLLLCFVLQGGFGALIVRVWTRDPWLQLSGAALFVLAPTLLMRVGHPALTAHFLLLWALWLYFSSARSARAPIASQGLLGVIAGLTHPYVAAMTLAILTSLPLRDRTARSVAGLTAAGAGTLAAWWVAGFVSVSATTDLSAGGLGLYSMNLLSPISPQGWSTMLPEVPVAHPLQAYEGFQYLGVGALALVAIALGLTATGGARAPRGAVFPVALVCGLSALYAVSPRITVGSEVLVDWTSPTLDRLAFFRASGRFFWPMTYLLLTGAIALVVSRLRTTAALAVLTAAVLLQLVDQRAAHAERRATSRSDGFHSWSRQFVSPVWHQLLPHYRHLVIVPATQCGGAPVEHEELAYLAGLHGLTINSGLGARWDVAARRRYCGGLDAAISRGEIGDDSIYLVTPAYEERLRAVAEGRVVCGALDAARICVTSVSYQVWRDRLPLGE
jgi:hypothetical protein